VSCLTKLCFLVHKIIVNIKLNNEIGYIYKTIKEAGVISFKYEFPLTKDYPFLDTSPWFRIAGFLAYSEECHKRIAALAGRG
jgi:hypothetical protein